MTHPLQSIERGTMDEDDSELNLFGYILPGERLTDEEQDAADQILRASKRMVFRPTDEILRRGSTARNLYHLLYGTTACVAANGQVLIRLGPGEMFGEISFLDAGDVGAAASVRAETEVECLVLSHETIEMLSSYQPLVAFRFWRNLASIATLRLRCQIRAIGAVC